MRGFFDCACCCTKIGAYFLGLCAACSRPYDRLVSRSPPIGRKTMRSVLDIILLILQIYIWLLIASAVLSWLIAFNVVNTRNQVVAMVADFLFRITEPV